MKNKYWISSLFILSISILVIDGCKKDFSGNKPTVTTNEVDPVTIKTTTASCGGNVTDNGGSQLLARGICWSRNHMPYVQALIDPLSKKEIIDSASKKVIILNQDSITEEATFTGPFFSTMTNLQPNTVYYVRAYAKNSNGYSYGEEKQFKTIAGSVGGIEIVYGEVTDIDKNVYKTVKIATQTWMAENLRVTKYKDGTIIPEVASEIEWPNQKDGAYCSYKNTINADTLMAFGRLYNWYAVSTNKLCPTGWHVPVESDWNTLISSLSGSKVAGAKLQNDKSIYWIKNTVATNKSAFSAEPAGTRSDIGVFEDAGISTSFWCFNNFDNTSAHLRKLTNNSQEIFSPSENKYSGLSVRCLKDK